MPEPGQWISPVQHLPHIWTAGIRKGIGPADLKLQDLPDTGQQQDSQEKFHWGPSMDRVAEARDLKPDQWLTSMNTYE